MGPAWGSIVSDYLSEERRGEYFGRRAQIVSIAGVVSMGFGGIFLSVMNKVSLAWGLFVVFLSAAVCRMISYCYMKRMVEEPYMAHLDDHFTFWMFIRRLTESNFVKFVVYVACITFATQLSAAYFNVYMLEDLKLDYLKYAAILLASVLM